MWNVFDILFQFLISQNIILDIKKSAWISDIKKLKSFLISKFRISQNGLYFLISRILISDIKNDFLITEINFFLYQIIFFFSYKKYLKILKRRPIDEWMNAAGP